MGDKLISMLLSDLRPVCWQGDGQQDGSAAVHQTKRGQRLVVLERAGVAVERHGAGGQQL